MGAKLVILDAELCTLTPPYYWLSTGVRGLDHCVEALCSLSATKRSDENAEKSLRLLVPGLLGCKADEGDLNARHRSMMGVIPAMANIRAGIPMGGSHAIGHQIGPLGVPHGITSCILCPAVVKYNLKYGKDPEIARKQQQTVNILRSIPEAATILQAAGRCDATDLGDILDSLIRALGLPRSLKEVGVGRDDIRDLPASALGDWWAPTNPVPLIEKSQVKEILESVLN